MLNTFQLELAVRRYWISRRLPTSRPCSTSTWLRRTVRPTWPDFAQATSSYRSFVVHLLHRSPYSVRKQPHVAGLAN